MLKRLWVTNDFIENYSVYLYDLYMNLFLERKKKKRTCFSCSTKLISSVLNSLQGFQEI